MANEEDFLVNKKMFGGGNESRLWLEAFVYWIRGRRPLIKPKRQKKKSTFSAQVFHDYLLKFGMSPHTATSVFIEYLLKHN